MKIKHLDTQYCVNFRRFKQTVSLIFFVLVFYLVHAFDGINFPKNLRELFC